MSTTIYIETKSKYATISTDDIKVFIPRIKEIEARTPQDVKIIAERTDYIEAKIPSRRVRLVLPQDQAEKLQEKRSAWGHEIQYGRRKASKEARTAYRMPEGVASPTND